MTLVLAPVVFGTLLAIPVHFMGKRLGGRFGGVFAAVILAILPGYFLIRTRAGAGDHNSAEPLFQALAVLAMMVALAVAEREKPVFEQFLDLLEEKTGKRTDISFDDWREGDQKVYVSDISKARSELGWEPQVPFEDGVERFVEWYENR